MLEIPATTYFTRDNIRIPLSLLFAIIKYSWVWKKTGPSDSSKSRENDTSLEVLTVVLLPWLTLHIFSTIKLLQSEIHFLLILKSIRSHQCYSRLSRSSSSPDEFLINSLNFTISTRFMTICCHLRPYSGRNLTDPYCPVFTRANILSIHFSFFNSSASYHGIFLT